MSLKSWKKLLCLKEIKCHLIKVIEDETLDETLYVYRWWNKSKQRWIYNVITDDCFDREVKYEMVYDVVQ